MDSQEERLGSTEGTPRRAPGRPPRSTAPSPSEDRIEEGERGEGERDYVESPEGDEEERLEMFRDSLAQSVLPDLPYMPGFHVCWLTTSNPRDSIQWRMRIGYELIRLSDLPGWEGVSLKTGDYSGIIGINEMVAARIPISLYNKYMREVHHNMPLSEEEKLRAKTSMMKQSLQEMGSGVAEEGDGTASIVQRARLMPEFDA
jgi:hypothetical protein